MSSKRFFRFFMLLAACLAPIGARTVDKSIPVITINDAIINPVTTEYIERAIDRAEREQAPVLVIELDTPGGLLSSTRVIVKRIVNAQVPVIVYVSPAGSRAGSAGVFITLAAHVAAMAPSTNIGAAHPVEFGESPKSRDKSLEELIEALKKEKKGAKTKEPKKKPEVESTPMADKILNDTVAWVTELAEARGRNKDWAVRAVKESISTGQAEALSLRVVDLVAKDVDDLLNQADGRRVKLGDGKEVILRTQGVAWYRVPMDLRQKVLNVLINPNIAYLLMMFGFYGLLFEITHPGSWFPGVAGLVCLILALYAFHTLPTNYAGMALIGLAILLFIAEVKVTSYGLLTIGGLISMFLGSLFLVDSSARFMQVSLRVIIPVVGSTALLFFFLVSLGVRAQKQTSPVGAEGLVGLVGEITSDGKLLVNGEIWDYQSSESLVAGERVKIAGFKEGMKLEVKKI